MTTLDKAIILGLLAGLVIWIVSGDWKKQEYKEREDLFI